jgi:hypothetical protein
MPRSQKGLAGNPAGKPNGACDKRMQLRELLTTHAEGACYDPPEYESPQETRAPARSGFNTNRPK